ncbi:MAG TPA: EamA family transporter [Vicinamibacterales bacterium]|nr:EamA family transporter [Vicinamibacterales bacterium]
MSSSRSLHTKTFVLIVLVVLLSSIGNVLLSVGMKRVGAIDAWSVDALARVFLDTFTNPFIWLGIGSLLAFFICYLALLSWADYSFVTPVSAIGYAVVPLLGWALLGESVSDLRWSGIACICGGVLLISRTPPSTTGPS